MHANTFQLDQEATPKWATYLHDLDELVPTLVTKLVPIGPLIDTNIIGDQLSWYQC